MIPGWTPRRTKGAADPHGNPRQRVNERLAALTAAGTSVWLDQIRAQR